MSFITPLPPAPSRTDAPDDFSAKADALLGALPDMVDEINDLYGDGGLLPGGGAAGAVLRKASASDQDVAWVGFRGALAKKASSLTGQNLTTAAAIALTDETYDTDTLHDNSTNNSRLTVPAGVSRVRVCGQVQLDNLTASQWAVLDVRKNGGALTPAIAASGEVTSTTSYIQVHSYPIAVSPGDYFELFVQVQSDTSVDINAAGTWFALEVMQ